MASSIFCPADLLLPKSAPMEEWAVVACDQFSAQPAYWEEVREKAKGKPSAFHLIFPECWLEHGTARAATEKIQAAMEEYLSDGVFREVHDRYIYLERTLSYGGVRRGLVGALDLEGYSYRPGAGAKVRATEGTVADRLPPRMAVRRGAALELPHVMVLIDDRARSVIEPLTAATHDPEAMTPEYSGPLMMGGGSIRGWSLCHALAVEVQKALAVLEESSPMAFAVGDGNHSLAAAKECFEELKKTLPREQWEIHPARYALVELVNLYDEALTFEPIHRVVFGVRPSELLAAMTGDLKLTREEDGIQSMGVVTAVGEEHYWIGRPPAHLTVGSVQYFLDDYLMAHPQASVDYIHGEEDLRGLVAGREDAVGFLLPPMPKEELFPAVLADGVLPRKTFSMGHARDKRYYLECRRIR